MIENAIKLLQNWYEFCKPKFIQDSKNTDCMCYGTGYSGWAVQTNQKALASFAMLGTATKKADIIDTALKMLRFSLNTHIVGDMCCYDGKKWGHSWISSLGIERMMHGVNELIPYMDKNDKSLLKEVLVSECDWITDFYDVEAGLYQRDGNNRPESNMWNGAILYRTAKMYPDLERAKIYEQKAEEYFLNSVSLSKDIGKDGVKGSNFFDSYALNHHCYLNIGYMVITISQIAMLHFSLKKSGIEPPKNLYNNLSGLWRLVKSCLTPDGRLIRIGGDSRVRYCYCQDYIIPTLLFIKDFLNDKDCDAYLKGWLSTINVECNTNGDGSFLSTRCGNMEKYSPIYYSRLESDRANAISFMLIENDENTEAKKIDNYNSWYDKYHGSCLINTKNSILSWTWRGSDGPLGLCVPKSDSSLAEYNHNMVGEVEGIGTQHMYMPQEHTEHLYEGGFVTNGSIEIIGRGFLAEQQDDEKFITESISAAVLPDSTTMVVLQSGKLNKDRLSIINSTYGLNLKIPNDVFNDFSRTYNYNNGEKKVQGVLEDSIINMGNWINIDEKLGVVLLYPDNMGLKLKTSRERKAKIKTLWKSENYNTGNLGFDRIVAENEEVQKYIFGESEIIDCGFAVIANVSDEDTKKTAEHKKIVNVTPNPDIKYTEVLGQDDNVYIFAANFSKNKQDFIFNSNAMDVVSGETVLNKIKINVNDSVLLRIID